MADYERADAADYKMVKLEAKGGAEEKGEGDVEQMRLGVYY